jgi:hypothetical protein
MNRNKAAGTRWESAIVEFLRANGFPWAERRALAGALDRGDIVIGPGAPIVEAKNRKALDLANAVDEANAEAANAGAPFGVAVLKRRGKGSAGDGYAVMTLANCARLLREAGYGSPLEDADG